MTHITPDLAEAKRLFDGGFKLCKLRDRSKRPAGGGWNFKPVDQFNTRASGYGILLAANGLCSVDPDNAPLAIKMLAGLGFDLESIMAAGVRTSSTRPTSGGRSAFCASEGLRWVKFSFKGIGTVLELRACAPNLQDAVPGLVYLDNTNTERTQSYANGRRLDDAPSLPADFRDWWLRLSTDVDFLRAEQRRAGEILGVQAQQAISAGDGQLAYGSRYRSPFNAANDVQDILTRHGYVQSAASDRYSPPSATGAAGVRPIPGKEGLWQSDHASDPLFGTFDAWTAFVVLDHKGDQVPAEQEAQRAYEASILEDFDVIADQDQGQPGKFEIIQAADFAAGPPPAWIVRDVLPEAALCVVYGESGSGKSFFVLDLVGAVARGALWQGHKVKQGRVVYVAAEGAGGFRKRLTAYATHTGINLADMPLGVVAAAPNLLGDDDKALAQAIVASGGASIVVVDTLAQATPGGNENSSEDMGKAAARCKRLHEATGALVLLVHHSGKDASRGARGWSGLRAAVDAEIEITISGDYRQARITKQKDGDGGAVFPFRLQVQVVGQDTDGLPVTSCVLDFENVAAPTRPAKVLGPVEQVVYDVACELDMVGRIECGAVITEAARRLPPREGKRDTRKQRATRTLYALCRGDDAVFCRDENSGTLEVLQ